MIAIVHSIYSQSVHAPALDAGLMDNDAERYCTYILTRISACKFLSIPSVQTPPPICMSNMGRYLCV